MTKYQAATLTADKHEACARLVDDEIVKADHEELARVMREIAEDYAE